MKLVVLRGIPGSGKSYLGEKMIAEAIAEGKVAVKVSADDYFMDSDGNYKFNPAMITDAHASCFRGLLAALQSKADLVVVDNTNLQCWEISPYILAANAHNYAHEIVNVRCDSRAAFARQSHGVPLVGHDRMSNTFVSEKLLPFWNVRDVFNNPS